MVELTNKQLTFFQQEILTLIKEHKAQITTVREWDKYAKEHNLPSSTVIIRHFDTWNKFKEKLHLTISKQRYDKETLLKIAKEHQQFFTSKRVWDNYATQNGLPKAITYIHIFGSWNTPKELLNIEPTKKKGPRGYTADDIIKVLKEHGQNLKNRKQWDEYAREHNLPTYKTLRKHFTWEEILNMVNKRTPKRLSIKKLLEIGKEHYESFLNSTIHDWNEYAKELNLPSVHTFYRMFGSWKKAKIEVYHYSKKEH